MTHARFMFAVLPSLGGRQYETDNEEQMEWGGRFVGRIHQTGRQSSFGQRPTFGLDVLCGAATSGAGAERVGARLRMKDALLSAVDKLNATLQQSWHSKWQPIRLHERLSSGNIYGVMGRCSSISTMHAPARWSRVYGCWLTVAVRSS